MQETMTVSLESTSLDPPPPIYLAYLCSIAATRFFAASTGLECVSDL